MKRKDDTYMAPVIGLIPLVDEERESYWMLPGYMKGIEEAGGIPLMLPLTENREHLAQLAELCDGLLLTGGHDVSPSLYRQEKTPLCGACSPERDQMESVLLQLALQKDMPVLGICRGIQFLNAFLGGTLYQDLPSQHPSEIAHHQKPPYHIPCHTVAILPDTPLSRLLEKDEIPVNSCHHQAILDLSPDLKAMAVSPDDLTEAAYMPDKAFVWAVQWHPECSHHVNEDSRKIFSAFVKACENRGI